MKTSFYKKSCRWLVMLVALFTVSLSGMAEKIVFTMNTFGWESPYYYQTINGVTAKFNGGSSTGQYNMYGYGTGHLQIVSSDAKIEKVEMECVGYRGSSPNVSYSSTVCTWTGEYSANATSFDGMSTDGGIAIWQGTPTTSIYFSSSSDIDVRALTVYTEDNAVLTNYTINFIGEIPAGCSATLDGKTFTENGTYEVAKNFNTSSLTTTTTSEYYGDVNYDATNHTYTVEFKHWYTYNFVVSIPAYNPNAAVYGGDRYYENGESRQTKTALEESTFVAYDLNGYDENVAVTGSDYTYTVTATYTESAPIDYTIIIPEEPAGISVTVNDAIYYNAPGTYHYSTPLTLAANKFVVAAPSGYYAANAYSCYNEETHTFTASVIEYLHYNVVVEGTTDANAGVVYNYTTYHNGETINSENELYASYVTPANVAGLVGEVALNDKTFTVTYTKPAYVDFDMRNSLNNGTRYEKTDGETTITATAWSYTANIYSYETRMIISNPAGITKIEFLDFYGNHITQGALASGGGSYSNGVWTGDATEVVLRDNNGDDFYIYTVRVYAKTSEPVDAPEFPLEGVAYEIKNVNRGRFLTLQSSATYAAVLNSTKEEIYFTWDEMKAGFTITDADGNYMGTAEKAWNIGSTTPEYWTVEDLGSGHYAFKSKTSNYLGFDAGDNGFRDKGANNDYAFTITPILKGNELGVDTDGNYWTTFSNVKPTLLPEEYTPYIVTGADETLTLVAIEDHIVPANTGVLVMSEEPAVDGVAYEVLTANTTSTTDVSENLLRAGDGTYWDNESNYYYMFSLNGTDDEGSVGFYWAIEGGHGVMTKLNKAYLVLDATANVRGFRLDGKADATEGIFNALNGQEEAGAMFNLNGQRVNGKPAAGVYVKNGRKLIVK